MAVTNAQAEQKPPVAAAAQKTTLDSDVSKPGVVAPGDAPFDTVDATEIATSVRGDKMSAGLAGFGVVNAVVKLDRIPGHLSPEDVAKFNGGPDGGGERSETYQAVSPDGKIVTVNHNIDTGETSVS
jgi:hypothetical protein